MSSQHPAVLAAKAYAKSPESLVRFHDSYLWRAYRSAGQMTPEEQAFAVKVQEAALWIQSQVADDQVHMVRRLTDPKRVNFRKLVQRGAEGVPAKPRLHVSAGFNNAGTFEVVWWPVLDPEETPQMHYSPGTPCGDFIAAGGYRAAGFGRVADDDHVAPFAVVRVPAKEYELEASVGTRSMRETGNNYLLRTLIVAADRFLKALSHLADVEVETWLRWDDANDRVRWSSEAGRVYEHLAQARNDAKNRRTGAEREIASMLKVRKLASEEQYQQLLLEAAAACTPAHRHIGKVVGRGISADLLATLDAAIERKRAAGLEELTLANLAEDHRPHGYPDREYWDI